MTTRFDVLEVLSNGENSGVEFKRDTVDPRQLAKELVALSNLGGGRVLLGVDDDGSVVGVTRTNLEEWVMTVCRDKVRPEIIPFFEIVRDVVGDKHVAVVRVEPGYDVHHVWHDLHRTYYIRVGTLSREASPEELGRLFQRRGSVRAELRPVSGSGLDALDPRRYRDYFGRVLPQELPGIGSTESDVDEEREQWQRLLTLTELLTDSGSASMAGLLLFGRQPHRFLPQSGIDAAAYPGMGKDYATLERATLRGPLLALVSVDGPVEAGLVEQGLDFVRRNAGREVTLAEGVRREERPAYPDDVVREVLVNALVHRDYLLASTTVELSLFADRLEVTSPGRLPNGITAEAMRVGARSARNQLLKDVMRDFGYLEHMGMGVPRKIVAGMRAHNGTDPEFVEGPESLTVTLWRSSELGQVRVPRAHQNQASAY